MKIAIFTLGTRGDVQPYAVLGQALMERGHRVTLSTAKNFESLVRGYGIDFAPVDADFQAFLASPEGKKMMGNPFRAKKHLRTWVYPMLINALHTFYALAKDSDKVLFHVKTLADYFADQFPGKMIRANLIPAEEPTAAFANPVFSVLPIPAFLNRLSYALTSLGLKMMREPISTFRTQAGLPPTYTKLQLPSIYAISQHFLPKPPDYPANSAFTGFWTKPSQEELSPDLLQFAAQEPPLLITFGSMPFETRLNLPQALNRITKELGIRLIVVKGWGLTDTQELDANPSIKVIASAPFDKLLPLTRAAIHHGGIGTTAACLQAGKPFLVCPILYPIGDQHFWGSIAQKKGVALKPIPLKKMTEELLLQNVSRLLETPELYHNAAHLMQLLKQENGLENAINIIEGQ